MEEVLELYMNKIQEFDSKIVYQDGRSLFLRNSLAKKLGLFLFQEHNVEYSCIYDLVVYLGDDHRYIVDHFRSVSYPFFSRSSGREGKEGNKRNIIL